MRGIKFLVFKKCKLLTVLLCFLFFSFSLHAETIYELDFTSATGNVKEWFLNKNWKLHEDINDMNIRFDMGRLVIEPTKDEVGVMMHEFEKKDYLKGEIKLRIEWGVDQYPKGADWSGPKEKTRNAREAVSFMVFFGEKKIESGFFLAPDLPYFISFFLGENEKPDQVYYANYWQEGGRYLCIPCDGTIGKTFLTEVNLTEKFKQLFMENPPPVSGLAIEVDVQNTEISNGRHSKAFIKKIKLYR